MVVMQCSGNSWIAATCCHGGIFNYRCFQKN